MIKKVPRTLIDIYRLAIKGVKLESFREGDEVHIISHRDGNRPYENFWAILSPYYAETIEQEPNGLRQSCDLKMYETIELGVIDPRAIAQLKKFSIKVK